MSDNNPFLVVAIGNFNARSSRWCINDKSNYEETKIDCLPTEYDLKQVINEPTHICLRILLLLLPTRKLPSSNSLCKI